MGDLTRLAPTPSGYLHLGNVVNVLLTAWLARGRGARLVLRIDDFDVGRVRRDYLANIFDTLRWLGVSPDAGPRDAEEFPRWSMGLRSAEFRARAQRLAHDHPDTVFACRCSRRELSHEHGCAAGWCAAGCRDAGHRLTPGATALRLHVPLGSTTVLLPTAEAVPVPAGDHVLWRRDDLVAYQLGSVLVDEQLRVTDLVRGVDLLESSALQVHLAGLLGADRYLAARHWHHGLVSAPDGSKLSKSAGGLARPLDRVPELRERAEAMATAFGAPLGIGPA